MKGKAPPKCEVCTANAPKYTCKCGVKYCSVKCYKTHQSACGTVTQIADAPREGLPPVLNEATVKEGGLESVEKEEGEEPLRPLSSLRWPFMPEAPSFQDPLSANDPKALTLKQYEAIATSVDLRRVLASNPKLSTLLADLDSSHPRTRDEQLQQLLGTGAQDSIQLSSHREGEDLSEAFREFAEAIEQAVWKASHAQRSGLEWD